ncbi:MAG TPA: hypothetical protein VFE63_21810 [Roseiarcus sp.]|jgi:hypothetical protein|nr:hypothetical protein [Roseiarcus sp.]
MKKATSRTADSRNFVPVSTMKALRQRHFGLVEDELKEAAPTKAAKDKATSITGRDGYIVPQALIYAIAHIQSLPSKEQEWSNMADMCAIARAHDASTMGAHAADVYAHTGPSGGTLAGRSPPRRLGFGLGRGIQRCPVRSSGRADQAKEDQPGHSGRSLTMNSRPLPEEPLLTPKEAATKLTMSVKTLMGHVRARRPRYINVARILVKLPSSPQAWSGKLRRAGGHRHPFTVLRDCQ